LTGHDDSSSGLWEKKGEKGREAQPPLEILCPSVKRKKKGKKGGGNNERQLA